MKLEPIFTGAVAGMAVGVEVLIETNHEGAALLSAAIAGVSAWRLHAGQRGDEPLPERT